MDAQPPSVFPMGRMAQAIREDLKSLHDNWYWYVILGVLLTLLGVFILSSSLMVTLVTLTAAKLIGYVLIIGGVFYLVGAFFTGGWGGFFLGILAGVLHLVLGVLVLRDPERFLLVFTLLLAAFFFVEGIFRIIAALTGQFRHWGWVLLNGIVTLILGILIWQDWKEDSFYIVGLFIGIDLIFSGVGYLTLGLRAKSIPA